MRNAFAIVTLTGLLTACAVAPPPQSSPAARAAQPMPATGAEAAAQQADDAAEAEQAQAAAQAALPGVELSSALLYQLLKTEFEIQKGNWQNAYQGLMTLARQTRDPRLASRATELAMRAREYKEARASVRLWRELAPAAEDALHFDMGLAMMLGDFGAAEQLFARRLKEAAPQARGMIMYQVQQVLARAPDKTAASALLERLLAPYAGSFEARVLLAQNAFGRGDAGLARSHAQQALALKPDSEMAVLTLAQVTSDAAAASAVLQRFLAANPGAREVRLAHARLLLANKQYDPARREFDAVLAQQPDSAAALYGLGLAAVHLNERAAAEQYFSRYAGVAEQASEDERDLGKVQLLLSQLATERGDAAAALAWLEKISERDSDIYFSAQMQRASLMARQGDVAGARKFLSAIEPEQPSARAQLLLVEGQILRDAGQLEAAFGLLAEGARRYPASTELLYDYALVAEKLGRTEVMETALRSVIAQAPANHDAYNALGYSLAERNVRLDEALRLISRALELAPDNAYILDSMGWVHYRLGNLAEAETHLRRAYALRQDPDVAVHLGEVLWSKGQKAAAQQLWREARARDPHNGTLRSTLSRLQLSL